MASGPDLLPSADAPTLIEPELPREFVSQAIREIRESLAAVAEVQRRDLLRNPPDQESGDRQKQYSISINDQWRICFRFSDGDAFDVEICDYH